MSLFETIPYKVIKKEGRIEIRQYDNFLLASTKTGANPRLDSGFTNVFDYISGGNETNTKISMTTPVVTYEEKEQLVTGFYVPKKYSKATAPKPVGSQVFIHEHPKAYYAVIRFSGSWKKAHFDAIDLRLQNYLKEKKIQIISLRYIMRYQPPFVPPFLRRNEIAYQVDYLE